MTGMPGGLGLLGLAKAEVTFGDWVWVTAPFGVYFGIVIVLTAFGRYQGETMNPLRIWFGRISDALRRSTGYPGWAMAGGLTGLFSLALAAMGAYWDIAWHVDLGRDESLLTPPHSLILLGLGGLLFSALLASVFATFDGARTGPRLGRLRVPWSAIGLYSLGVGGVVAFPLDALWHNAYGIDVTLWSPTHLLLLASGSLGTIAVWLMIAEGRPGARPTPLGKAIQVTTAAATLTGLSTFQAEFDFGVPGFQVVYLPMLIGIAAGFTLVLARLAIGRFGALWAAIGFVVLRLAIVGMLGSLDHSLTRFPLYLPAAVAVEAVAWKLGTSRVMRFAVVSGLAAAVVGVVGETFWAQASGWYSPPGSGALVIKVAVLTPAVAIAAAVLAAGLARAFTGTRVGAAALAGAGLVLVLGLAYPLPRNVGNVEAIVRLRPGPGDGRSFVDVELSPPDAAENANAFGVLSWQGGGRVAASLRPTGELGRYTTSRSLPVGGDWKTVVGLQRGSEVMATAVALPADPKIGAEEVAAVPERRVRFGRNTTVTMRESHPGPAWPSLVSYLGIALVSVGWVALFALTASRVAPGGGARLDAPGSRKATSGERLALSGRGRPS